MLHNNFIVCMMTCSVLALLYMFDKGDYDYIILPIGILIWGIFKFFDENDRKYLEDRGIDPDEFNAFFPDEYDNTYKSHHRTHTPSTNSGVRSGNTITWNSPSDSRREAPYNDYYGYGGYDRYSSYGTYNKKYQNPVYKNLVKKCKRNFKITVDKESKNESRKGIFHGINHSGW